MNSKGYAVAAATATAAVAGFTLGTCYRAGLVTRRARTICSSNLARSPPPKPVQKPLHPFKVGLCQLKVGTNKAQNILGAEAAIREAASKGAKLVVLPEMWNCPYSNESFPEYAEEIDLGESPSAMMLSNVARELGVVVVGGSIPERQGDRLYNTCCVYNTEGTLLAKHRKTHLFDIDIPGQITFKESDTLTQGEAGTVVDTEVGRLGIGICFDVRFPELAAVYAARGASMLIYPGAFNMVTGPLHWQLLHQARAVDNQLYVACCSPARNPDSSYRAWGHSMVIGPFAEILASCESDPEIILADIDPAQIDTRRTNMPLAYQRRADLYCLTDCKNTEAA
uniref:CN hydrolase domain-containing protein n=1 Tax=Pyramimonas obovata TaxID=1411642 RepID=A0A7S0MVI9_9CHLO|mmetsp:Transcript_11779/g.24714  ORF Transcript_11779/g.24714 Transcript_11779/m.24714 type:complete len:339 (+) Transcript_11779:229-1245(+)|eukprot:CAMPEP_0118923304 /NCGR_PEP_ID=MMETSP1169-20130426/1884_1 /TAXON_ID=36882 /ORGANISM="Pyramimonas obovata, Strain CCMP722" /LENGTH=338 /DNA_ID=CAMNT_0006864271 /DNA_START=154 /DNA_END=1170 /DNA_ORIENTATION=-